MSSSTRCPRLLARPPQLGGVELEAGDRGQPVEQRDAGLGIGHGREVVRHLRPQPDGGQAGLGEAALDRGLHARGHVEGAGHESDPTGPAPRWWRWRPGAPAGCGARARGTRRSRPRGGCRAPGPGRPPRRERPPLVVGLGPDEEEHVAARRIDGRPAARSSGHVRPRVDAVDEVQRRAVGPGGRAACRCRRWRRASVSTPASNPATAVAAPRPASIHPSRRRRARRDRRARADGELVERHGITPRRPPCAASRPGVRPGRRTRRSRCGRRPSAPPT